MSVPAGRKGLWAGGLVLLLAVMAGASLWMALRPKHSELEKLLPLALPEGHLVVAVYRSPCLERGPFFTCEWGDKSQVIARVESPQDGSHALATVRAFLGERLTLSSQTDDGFRFRRPVFQGTELSGEMRLVSGNQRIADSFERATGSRDGAADYEIVLDNYIISPF